LRSRIDPSLRCALHDTFNAWEGAAGWTRGRASRAPWDAPGRTKIGRIGSLLHSECVRWGILGCYTLRGLCMDDELVLLTSYYNLVDGRRQDASDTFRVDTHLPSASSPEGGALYIVTEASTSGHMGPRARRLAADTVAWEYASHADEAPP